MHENARGWRLDKLKQHHKIDLIVALSMACLAAIRGVGQYGSYDTNLDFVNGPPAAAANAEKAAAQEWQEMRMAAHIARYGGYRRF